MTIKYPNLGINAEWASSKTLDEFLKVGLSSGWFKDNEHQKQMLEDAWVKCMTIMGVEFPLPIVNIEENFVTFDQDEVDDDSTEIQEVE